MVKFFIKTGFVQDSEIVMEDPGDLKHLTRVLRKRVGDEIVISIGDDWEYTTEIVTIEENRAVFRITDRQKDSREPLTRVTLYQGLPKAQKMETVIQKTVELGVDSVVPVFMKRTVVTESGNITKKLDRWQKISDEAVKQCKRNVLPEIGPFMDFKEMIDDIKERKFDLVICPYEAEDNRTIKDCLTEAKAVTNANVPDCIRRVALIIGPEGGFEDKEIENLKNTGAEIVTLGRTILRTETAGPAALAMIMYELEL